MDFQQLLSNIIVSYIIVGRFTISNSLDWLETVKFCCVIFVRAWSGILMIFGFASSENSSLFLKFIAFSHFLGQCLLLIDYDAPFGYTPPGRCSSLDTWSGVLGYQLVTIYSKWLILSISHCWRLQFALWSPGGKCTGRKSCCRGNSLDLRSLQESNRDLRGRYLH